jgi:hypothetical protein
MAAAGVSLRRYGPLCHSAVPPVPWYLAASISCVRARVCKPAQSLPRRRSCTVFPLPTPANQQARPQPKCRLYIEAYTNDESKFETDAQDVLKSIIGTALEVSKLQEFTGRDKPTVIT